MNTIVNSAGLAQSVERKTLNLVVVGSSPTAGDFFFFLITAFMEALTLVSVWLSAADLAKSSRVCRAWREVVCSQWVDSTVWRQMCVHKRWIKKQENVVSWRVRYACCAQTEMNWRHFYFI